MVPFIFFFFYRDFNLNHKIKDKKGKNQKDHGHTFYKFVGRSVIYLCVYIVNSILIVKLF